jgi:hypothetical protein
VGIPTQRESETYGSCLSNSERYHTIFYSQSKVDTIRVTSALVEPAERKAAFNFIEKTDEIHDIFQSIKFIFLVINAINTRLT